MFVYQVGEFCSIDGGGWYEIVADNNDALANTKRELLKAHEIEITSLKESLNDDFYEDEKDLIMSLLEVEAEFVKRIKEAVSFDELNKIKVNGSTMRITIARKEVVE